MKHIFIVNPAAGNGRSEKDVLPDVLKFCAGRDIDYEVHKTLSAAETVSYTRQRSLQGDPVRFYACGGDGTLNNVLNGMIGSPHAELAYIPCGTGNDFARNYTNQENFLDIQKQVDGEAVNIDAIRLNDLYAINMYNIGVDCDVVVEVDKLKANPLLSGSMAYLAGVVKVLSRGKTYHMQLKFDDGDAVDEELFLAAIGNSRYCGGGFKSTPYASLSDGLMDVCVIRPIKGTRIVSLLAKYRKGTHVNSPAAAPYVIYKQCKKLTLATKEPMKISIDGEIADAECLEFEIVPNAVRFSIPAGSKLV
jgi:diacylglycerol kinase (ATP)